MKGEAWIRTLKSPLFNQLPSVVDSISPSPSIGWDLSHPFPFLSPYFLTLVTAPVILLLDYCNSFLNVLPTPVLPSSNQFSRYQTEQLSWNQNSALFWAQGIQRWMTMSRSCFHSPSSNQDSWQRSELINNHFRLWEEPWRWATEWSNGGSNGDREEAT